MRDNISQIGGSTGGSGGSDEEPTEPEPDSAPPVDDIQQPAPAPPEPEPDPEPPDEVDDIQRNDPGPPADPDPEPPGGGEDIQRDDPGPPAGSDPPAQGGSDDATGGGQTDTSGSDRGPLDRFVEDTLNPGAEAFDERIAETAGETIRDTSPATLIDSQIRGGNPVGRTVENSVRGAVNIANAPGIAAGLIRTGQRAADDTARVNEQGAAGRRQNRQELAADVVGAATATGAAIQDDPVGTLSRIGGGIIGGAAVGGAASRAARGLRGAPDGNAGGPAVATGRSDVGTGGVDQILDADTVDALRGTSGPSRRSRLRGEASRRLDDLDEMLPGGSDRGQLQFGGQGRGAGRSGGETPDAPRDFDRGRDPTRPPDGGGTIDDIRQDSLTQTQDQLRSDATRPAPGDFEPSPDPFGPGTRRGTISEGGDVELTRSTGGVATETGGASGAGATSRFSATGAGAGAAGAGAAGVGEVSQTTDPTGIAPDATVTGGSTLDPQRILGAGTDATGAETLSEPNDPTNIAPADVDEFGEQRLGGGTLPGDATGGGTDTGTLDETNDPSNVTPPGSETDTGSDTDTFAPTDTGTGTDQPPASDTDQPPASDTPAPPVTGTPPVTDTPVPQTPRPPTRTPVPPAVRPPVRRRPRRPPERDEERDPLILGDDDDDDDEPAPRPAAEAPLLPGFGAETFTAFATGAFGTRELATGADEPSLVGELPTQTLADPSDDEAGALAAVSEQFFGEFGGGG